MSNNVGDSIAGAAVAPLILGFSAVVWIFFGLFALLGFGWWNKRKDREFQARYGSSLDSSPYGEPERYKEPVDNSPRFPSRPFGAPPQDQWLLTFDFWQYRLEQITGIETTTTQLRNFLSAMFISLAPAVVVGLPTSAVLPQTDGLPFLGLGGVGLVVGFLTAMALNMPADWFPSHVHTTRGGSESDSIGGDSEEYIDIGEDVGRYW